MKRTCWTCAHSWSFLDILVTRSPSVYLKSCEKKRVPSETSAAQMNELVTTSVGADEAAELHGGVSALNAVLQTFLSCQK